MPARTVVLTALIASCVSSLVTLAVALLVLAPSIRAAPDPQAVQPVVRAERFELVNSSDQVQAVLGTQQPQSGTEWLAGVVGLGIIGDDGQVRSVIGIGQDNSPAAVLMDPSHDSRITVGTYPDGASRVVLTDYSGRLRAGLGSLPDGSALLELEDAAGQAAYAAVGRSAAPEDARPPIQVGGAGFFVVQEAGDPHVAATLGVAPDGSAQAALANELGATIWQAP